MEGRVVWAAGSRGCTETPAVISRLSINMSYYGSSPAKLRWVRGADNGVQCGDDRCMGFPTAVVFKRDGLLVAPNLARFLGEAAEIDRPGPLRTPRSVFGEFLRDTDANELRILVAAPAGNFVLRLVRCVFLLI